MALDETPRFGCWTAWFPVSGKRTLLSGLRVCLLAALAGIAWQPAIAAPQQTGTVDNDIPQTFTAPASGYDYVRREVMIPMRDGVKLFTVIIVPKGARNAPILLTRTPYDASKRTVRNNSTHMLATLPEADEMFVADGYIRVFQDVRGKYKSEGDYVMTRPVRGALNQTQVDHVTDAYDTIDWLVKNTPGVERTRGHDRLFVRGLYGCDGAFGPASGAEGRRAGEPHGGWLDGRRLVPLRRVPADQPRLHPGTDRAKRRGRRSAS
jgi:hypothetical protein